MTASDKKALLRAAVTAVRGCADKMEEHAASLLQALPNLPLDEGLRAMALEKSAGLRDVASRVTFELALLQTELGEAKADATAALHGLSRMDGTMMDALAAFADVVDQLERAAERDEANERPFVVVIEAAGVMLKRLEEARGATEALSTALPAESGRSSGGE